MQGLREKIARLLEAEQGYRGDEHYRIADRILAIPEIKIALAYSPKRAGWNEVVGRDGGRKWISDSDQPQSVG